ncbi:MAG: TlyA family RNA methyltransferase [Clostridia bacterium]|nr:TlyA family RNA methyltransferase [Clostridia bacterium]
METLRMRLDVALIERGIFESRTRAQRAVSEGCITVNGRVVTKASFDVSDTDAVVSSGDPLPFVSRGGLKLQGAIESFNLNLNGVSAIDIGASTGGFTEVLLNYGAKDVVAVDVGHGQLAPEIASDARVLNLEGTDFRNLPDDEFLSRFDFACSDVSFISVTFLLPKMYSVLKENGRAVVLIKPQFESDTRRVGKRGIVRDEKARRRAVEKVESCAEMCGFEVKRIIESPITGGDGNVEYLMYAVK